MSGAPAAAAGIRALLVAEPGVVDEATLRAALPAGTPARVVPLATAAERPAVYLDDPGLELVLVACAAQQEQALRVVAAAAGGTGQGTLPGSTGRVVVVLHAGTPNGFLHHAFSAGADDLVTLPQPVAALAFAVEKAVARRHGPAAAGTLGELVAVLGPKGGTGKTLTACNLAVALAREGSRTVVVDLDLQFGDVGLALGLAPERTIADLALSPGTLDAEKVEGYLLQHGSGARALLAPVRPDQAAGVSAPVLRAVLELLRRSYDVVVVDTPPAFTPEVIAAIDASTRLCVVSMLDALSLKDTKIGLETLAQMGCDLREVLLVLSRADSSVGISPGDVERLLGRRPDVAIPSDRAIPRALTDGVPIVLAAPRSAAARALVGLATRVLEGRSAPASAAAPARPLAAAPVAVPAPVVASPPTLRAAAPPVLSLLPRLLRKGA